MREGGRLYPLSVDAEAIIVFFGGEAEESFFQKNVSLSLLLSFMVLRTASSILFPYQLANYLLDGGGQRKKHLKHFSLLLSRN